LGALTVPALLVILAVVVLMERLTLLLVVAVRIAGLMLLANRR